MKELVGHPREWKPEEDAEDHDFAFARPVNHHGSPPVAASGLRAPVAGDAEDIPAYAIMTAPAPRLWGPHQSGDRGTGRTGLAAPAALRTCPAPRAARVVIRRSGRHSEASTGGER